jgi:hypothetical protein
VQIVSMDEGPYSKGQRFMTQAHTNYLLGQNPYVYPTNDSGDDTD